MGPQNCINERVHLFVAGIINTLTDLLIFLLPIPTVLRLRIPVRQQVILTMLFGAGFIVCVAGCVRTYYTWRATSTYDRTWESYGVWISSMIELYVGIVSRLPHCSHSILTITNRYVPLFRQPNPSFQNIYPIFSARPQHQPKHPNWFAP